MNQGLSFADYFMMCASQKVCLGTAVEYLCAIRGLIEEEFLNSNGMTKFAKLTLEDKDVARRVHVSQIITERYKDAFKKFSYLIYGASRMHSLKEGLTPASDHTASEEQNETEYVLYFDNPKAAELLLHISTIEEAATDAAA